MVSRNLGAAALGLVFVPLMLFGGRKIQLWFMVAVSCLMIVLPGLQQNKLIPLNTAVEIAGKISPERAYSLQYRIDNEQAILERASERPMFGWGTWARWRIYDENGRDLSTVDGLWISIFGEYGWVGYLTYFSLIGLIMTGNLIYMIPNAAGSPLSWLMAGALIGFGQFQNRKVEAEEVVTADSKPQYYRRNLGKGGATLARASKRKTALRDSKGSFAQARHTRRQR